MGLTPGCYRGGICMRIALALGGARGFQSSESNRCSEEEPDRGLRAGWEVGRRTGQEVGRRCVLDGGQEVGSAIGSREDRLGGESVGGPKQTDAPRPERSLLLTATRSNKLFTGLLTRRGAPTADFRFLKTGRARRDRMHRSGSSLTRTQGR